MNRTERRLRALEMVLNMKPLRPVRRIIVEPGETVEEVCAREGIDPECDVIARMIVEPKIVVAEAGFLSPSDASHDVANA